MAPRPIPDEALQETLAALRAAGGNQSKAAEMLGLSRPGFRERLAQAKRRGMITSIEDITAAYVQEVPDLAPRQPPKYRRIGPHSGMVRVLAIGDAHDDPRIPNKARFALMGRHAAATRPDVILSIGDMFDLASLSTHEREDTYKARGKPTFMQDMESARLAMEALEAELPADYKPRKHMTKGNHEHRADRAEDADPKSLGMYVGAVDTLLESHGWTHQGYGHWTMIAGVGFTHAPMSIMGRPLGGKNVENTIANEATFSIVFGHTHRFNVVRRAKQGYGNGVTVVNLGCAMPEQYLPSYATALPTGYTYGIVDMVLMDGQILSANLRTFRELEALYGAKAAA